MMWEDIKRVKINEIQQKEKDTPLDLLEELALTAPDSVSLAEALINPLKSHTIAEFKRKSPIDGEMAPNADAMEVVSQFLQSGACAISIATDGSFYGGNIDDLHLTKQIFREVPVIMREYIVDPYQIVEARALGSDAIILHGGLLTAEEVASFARLAHALEMEVVFESSNEKGLKDYHPDVDIIMVHHRYNHEDVATPSKSLSYVSQLPADKVRVGGGGLKSYNQRKMLIDAGFDAVIIGTSLMKSKNHGDTLHSIIVG